MAGKIDAKHLVTTKANGCIRIASLMRWNPTIPQIQSDHPRNYFEKILNRSCVIADRMRYGAISATESLYTTAGCEGHLSNTCPSARCQRLYRSTAFPTSACQGQVGAAADVG